MTGRGGRIRERQFSKSLTRDMGPGHGAEQRPESYLASFVSTGESRERSLPKWRNEWGARGEMNSSPHGNGRAFRHVEWLIDKY